MGQQLSTNTFGSAKWIVSADPTAGTHTTITAAIASASSGDTILIRPGIYSETFNVNKNLNFFAYDPESRDSNPNVQINTSAVAGAVVVNSASITCGFFGIRFNSTLFGVAISLTGNGSTVTCQNCYFANLPLGSDVIDITGNSSTNLYLENCSGNVNGVALFNTTNGNVRIKDCTFIDSTGPGDVTTSSGTIFIYNSQFNFGVTTFSSGKLVLSHTEFGPSQTPFTNKKWITLGGASATAIITGCSFYSGSASCISIASGCTADCYGCVFNSSSTPVLSGAGTIRVGLNTFSGTSSSNTVTTITQKSASDQTLNALTSSSITNSGLVSTGSLTSGSFVVASDFAIGSNSILSSPDQPYFFAYSDATQGNVTGDDTPATFICNKVLFDVGAGYNAFTGLYTVPVTGIYKFTAFVQTDSTPPGARGSIRLFVNGSGSIYGNDVAGTGYPNNFQPLPMSALVALTTNDTVEVLVNITQTVPAMNVGLVGSGTISAYFCGAKLF